VLNILLPGLDLGSTNELWLAELRALLAFGYKNGDLVDLLSTIKQNPSAWRVKLAPLGELKRPRVWVPPLVEEEELDAPSF
jgi:hypothetical protein